MKVRLYMLDIIPSLLIIEAIFTSPEATFYHCCFLSATTDLEKISAYKDTRILGY